MTIVADRYVDLDQRADCVVSGTDTSSDLLKGPAGLRRAIDLASAGEVIALKGGTIGYSSVYLCGYSTASGGPFVIGEEVQWDSGTSSGVIMGDDIDYSITIDVLAGSLQNGDTLVGQYSGATCDITSGGLQNYDDTSPFLHDSTIPETLLTGNNTDGYVKFIGVNSSWENDGTRVTFDGEDVIPYGLDSSYSQDYMWYENLRWTRFTIDGWSHANYLDFGIVINCKWDNCSYGLDSLYFRYGLLLQCVVTANDNVGAEIGAGSFFLASRIHANGDDGLWAGSHASGAVGSLIYDNGGFGLEFRSTTGAKALFNVVDNNTYDNIKCNTNVYPGLVLFNRITNSAEYGFDMASAAVVYGYNYFGGNTSGNVTLDSIAQHIPNTNKNNSNEMAGADTDHGYIDLDGNNYNLASGASLRRTGLVIPES